MFASRRVTGALMRVLNRRYTLSRLGNQLPRRAVQVPEATGLPVDHLRPLTPCFEHAAISPGYASVGNAVKKLMVPPPDSLLRFEIIIEIHGMDQ